MSDLDQAKVRAAVQIKCRTGAKLTAAEIEAIRQHPDVLTSTANNYSVLAAAAYGYGVHGGMLNQLSDEGLITPEMLLKPSGCFVGVGYGAGPIRQGSNLEMIEIRDKATCLDPAVYRKAVAMSFRKEESLGDQRQWTADRRNTLWQVKWNSDAYGWGESGLAEIEADPGLVMGPAPAYGLLYHALVMAGQGKPELLKQLNPYITPEMLVTEVKDNFYYDMLSRAMADGTDRYLDPKVVRQATATKHQKEESLSRRFISQLV